MAPKLYMHPASYPVRSVLMTAKALDVELELIEVNLLNKDQLKPEYLKLNPLHTVPTLEEEDGFSVWDSHAIVIYLAEKYGKDDSIYPKDLKKRTAINQRLFYSQGYLMSSAIAISRAVILEGMKEIPDKYSQNVHNALGFLEKFLEESKFVAGDQISIADICILSTATSIDIFMPITDDRYPKICNWLKCLQEQPFYEENVAGLELFKTIYNEMLSTKN